MASFGGTLQQRMKSVFIIYLYAFYIDFYWFLYQFKIFISNTIVISVIKLLLILKAFQYSFWNSAIPFFFLYDLRSRWSRWRRRWRNCMSVSEFFYPLQTLLLCQTTCLNYWQNICCFKKFHNFTSGLFFCSFHRKMQLLMKSAFVT